MIKFDTQYRVCYGDTDQMGVVYHGNYPKLFEIGRTEMFRHLNLDYKTIEANGIMLPVVNININYKKPAKYDDLLTIRTFIKQIKGVKIIFNYELYNQQQELLSTGETTLVFVDKKTQRPTSAPQNIIDILNK